MASEDTKSKFITSSKSLMFCRGSWLIRRLGELCSYACPSFICVSSSTGYELGHVPPWLYKTILQRSLSLRGAIEHHVNRHGHTGSKVVTDQTPTATPSRSLLHDYPAKTYLKAFHRAPTIVFSLRFSIRLIQLTHTRDDAWREIF